MNVRNLLTFVAWVGVFSGSLVAQTLSPALQAKLETRLVEIEAWAATPVLVDAVKAQNAQLPADYTGMTQEKWRALTVLDPLVRGLTRSPAGGFLKGKKSDLVTEAFLSDAQGRKIAFIAKSTNWSHLGKDKHDVPMGGSRWVGPIEVDESSGQQQIQVAVPVLDGGKPVGSLVVGLSVSGLAKE